MSAVLAGQVGTLDLVDLNAISQFYGRDFLPYPFRLTQGPRFATSDEASAYVSTVPDRFNHGDLSSFIECVAAYDAADIRVECHVQYIPADTPSLRVIAYRSGHLGFFAAQRPDDDLIDVYAVSPYDLGAAVSDAVSLTQPGMHSEIVIPEYIPRGQAEFDKGALLVRHCSVSASEVRIPASDVTAYSTIQSHWRPTRKWGLDRGKRALVWVRVNDDGEYIYVPDHSHAKPMTKSFLREQVDQLIADDVAILREFRRD
ncbi:ESX secretion-associated protein EspG [Mycobacterium sp. Dal123C01]|uniref:ESX secretion-associated protein EspG n=1 Tax=Mycobacterium sp. Dal123C01 TaxID=3457577 RepID=UPI00403E6678